MALIGLRGNYFGGEPIRKTKVQVSLKMERVQEVRGDKRWKNGFGVCVALEDWRAGVIVSLYKGKWDGM